MSITKESKWTLFGSWAIEPNTGVQPTADACERRPLARLTRPLGHAFSVPKIEKIHMVYRESIVLVLMATLLGCTSFGTANLGTKITRENNKVQMPHYSFSVPPDVGWHVRTEGDPLESVTVAMNPVGLFLLQMKFIRNTILDDKLRNATAKQVADDYREKEKNIMIEQGVKKGQYELSELTMSEERLSGRTFYTMKYRVDSKNNFQGALLYLLFPKESHNEWFIAAHYSVTAPQNVYVADSRKSDFLTVLQSLETQ